MNNPFQNEKYLLLAALGTACILASCKKPDNNSVVSIVGKWGLEKYIITQTKYGTTTTTDTTINASSLDSCQRSSYIVFLPSKMAYNGSDNKLCFGGTTHSDSFAYSLDANNTQLIITRSGLPARTFIVNSLTGSSLVYTDTGSTSYEKYSVETHLLKRP